ncbi:MAG: GntR family transcriptional regulator [Ferruginibacter sp.]
MNRLTLVNDKSSLPKYRQIVQSIIDSIEKGTLKKGHQLPSINKMAAVNGTAKETIAKAYAELKENGTIIAMHGKGFYIAKTKIKVNLNIFVLFDTFNAYKEILYTALKNALPPDTQFSIFFHHYNVRHFAELIKNNLGNYNFYVIMPHFDTDVSEVLSLIPPNKLLLLDKDASELKGDYAAVYQDFENDILNCLEDGINLIKKYKKLNLIVGKEYFQYVPAGIIKGFRLFLEKENIKGSVIDNLNVKNLKADEAYLIFTDTDMVRFIKYCDIMKWKPGKDIGLISYDDTPIKEILLRGVTVITTDFEQMGKTAGELIVGKRMEKIANPARILKRKTL